MKLEKRYTSESDDEPDMYEIMWGREKLIAQKPRRIRMLERNTNLRNRCIQSDVDKVSVNVQIAWVEEMVDLKTYLSKIGVEGENSSSILSNNMKSSSIDTNEEKYGRIKLLDRSSSSSEIDVNNDKNNQYKNQDANNTSVEHNAEGSPDIKESANKSKPVYLPHNGDLAKRDLTQSKRLETNSIQSPPKESYKNESGEDSSSERSIPKLFK